MKELFLQISNRQDLTQEQVQEVFDQILQNQLSESQSLPSMVQKAII